MSPALAGRFFTTSTTWEAPVHAWYDAKYFIPMFQVEPYVCQYSGAFDLLKWEFDLVQPNTVVMYGCESWTVKKAECRRIDAFELWCGRRLLRVPWTARRSNQSILKEISPGISLEGMMLKLKLQYFGHLIVMDREAWQAVIHGIAKCWT